MGSFLKYYLLFALLISLITAQNWPGNYTYAGYLGFEDCAPENNFTITQNGSTISITFTYDSEYCYPKGEYVLNLTVASVVAQTPSTSPMNVTAIYLTNNNTILFIVNDVDFPSTWLLNGSNTTNTLGPDLTSWDGNWTVSSSYWLGQSLNHPTCGGILNLDINAWTGTVGEANVTICTESGCSRGTEFPEGGAFFDLDYTWALPGTDNIAMMNPNGTITWISGSLGNYFFQDGSCQYIFTPRESSGVILKLVAAFYIILQIIYFI